MAPASPTVRVAGIEEDSITNGPGLRFVLFTQGCPHHCPGCHNPQTQAFDAGEAIPSERLLRKIIANPLVGGVTFSGGEPFCQAADLAPLALELKERGFEVAAYTGFTFEALRQNPDPAVQHLLQALDILVDGPFLLQRRDILLHFRGSDNQRILDVPASLRSDCAVWTTDPDWL